VEFSALVGDKLACLKPVFWLSFVSAMTLRLLEKEALELPPRSRVRLAERIIESVDDYADPQLEAAWDHEIERRAKEIASGAEKGIPAAKVMREARRALNETRRLPSARRK
jgi:putative addiction module component (TIGR02574 family)